MSYDGPSRPLLTSGRRRGYSLSEAGGLLDEEVEEERDLVKEVKEERKELVLIKPTAEWDEDTVEPTEEEARER